MNSDDLPNIYEFLAQRCRISHTTLRAAFSKKEVSFEVACRISNTLKIPLKLFRFKDDMRGRWKRKAEEGKEKG